MDALEGLEADGDLGPVLPLAERLPELLDRVELREVVVDRAKIDFSGGTLLTKHEDAVA